MTNSYEMFPTVVTAVEQLTPLIKRFTFKRQDGENFPVFTGGSHVILKLNDKLSNAYSLMSDVNDLSSYQVCVRKDVDGKGGSVFYMTTVCPTLSLKCLNPKIYLRCQQVVKNIF